MGLRPVGVLLWGLTRRMGGRAVRSFGGPVAAACGTIIPVASSNSVIVERIVVSLFIFSDGQGHR